MINPITKKLLEEDRLTLLTHLDHSQSLRVVKAGAQSRKLEAVTEVEAMKEYCLLTCSPELTQSALLYSSDLPAQGWYHPQWAESSHINHSYSQ